MERMWIGEEVAKATFFLDAVITGVRHSAVDCPGLAAPSYIG